MIVTEKLRENIFWFVDFVKGASVRKHLNEIKIVFDDTENFPRYKNIKLESILSYSTKNVPYYADFKDRPIELFPVIDKNRLKSNMEMFCSKQIKPNERISATTSGSTGTPFTVYHNKQKKFRNSADTIYFAHLGGYNLGRKLYYLKIWSKYNKKSRLERFMQNIEPIDVLNLKEDAQFVLEKLKSNKNPAACLGYTSAFETICKFLDCHPSATGNFNISSIITMSESLDDYTKLTAAKYFSCPVLSRYSNIENGILAQQTISSPYDFIINTASYYIEILHQDNDTVLDKGEQGRIVVTDYFNLAMPMIRYDTGDIGVMEERLVDEK